MRWAHMALLPQARAHHLRAATFLNGHAGLRIDMDVRPRNIPRWFSHAGALQNRGRVVPRTRRAVVARSRKVERGGWWHGDGWWRGAIGARIGPQATRTVAFLLPA